MTPEERQKFEQMEEQLERLDELFKQLSANTTIPHDIREAFKDAIAGDFEEAQGFAGGKTTLGADPTGVVVTAEPDGFMKMKKGGTFVNVPYFS